MHARPLRSISLVGLTSLILFGFAPSAHAAGSKDKEALALHDTAMDEDYLSVEFDKATKKLNDALKKCGKSDCSAAVIGKLHMSLGTVMGAGQGKLDEAKAEFVKALQADPKATLSETFATDDLRKAFADAKAQAGGGDVKPAGDGEEEEEEGEEGDKPVSSAGGDLTHAPIPEQTVNTPVPVYVEIPEELGVTAATLRYKPFGGKKWISLEMKKMGDGFGVEIPCDAVTTTGDIKYYVIAKDETGNPIATAGSLKAPHKIPVKNEIEGASPSLPGQKPPVQCAAKEDCPPGLPGCPDAKSGGGPRGDKGWGASCESTQECQAGYACLNGSCEEGAGGGEEEDAPSDGKKKKNLVGLFGGIDFLLISGADNVCGDGRTQNASYACFYTDETGGQFYGNPAATKTPRTNGLDGGFGIGGGRVTLGYDRLLLEKIGLSAGLRLGFAFGGSPSSDAAGPNSQSVGYQVPAQANSFMPVHAELRATYYIGGNTFQKMKPSPFVFLGGGLAQINASVPVNVCDKAERPSGEAVDANVSIGQCPAGSKPREVEAYQITGLNFIGLGGGATFGITDNIGVAAELKVMLMVPTFGVVFAPTIGPVYAF